MGLHVNDDPAETQERLVAHTLSEHKALIGFQNVVIMLQNPILLEEPQRLCHSDFTIVQGCLFKPNVKNR